RDQARPAADEAEGERRLAPWRLRLDGVQLLLGAEVLVAQRVRALLDDVVDAVEHAVGGRLALTHPYQRLDLASEAVRRGKHGALAGEVVGVPPQDVAEQDGCLV